jgi:capsular exopolysaccharide synthesis family protein
MSKMYEALKRAQLEGVAIEFPIPAVSDGLALPRVSDEPASNEQYPASNDRYDEKPANPEIRELPIQIASGSALIPWGASNGRGSEQYRIIRTRIVQHPERPRIMAVSSPGAGDGKTVSSINIAGALALRDNANVLLIDADFRRARVSYMLGLPEGRGLANTLSGSCSLQDAIVRVAQLPNLYVLPAGASDANPAELLDTDQWKVLCSTVRERFSFVIIDSPPIVAVADYELIQASCDGVIVVVRPDHTDRTLFNKAFELIPKKKKLGVVLNYSREWFLWKTHESYYYDFRG